MPLTTWAAVITLPSLEIRTPEPVSLKRVIPEAPTSRPLARTTTTDGLTRLKRSSRLWLWAKAKAAVKAGNVARQRATPREASASGNASLEYTASPVRRRDQSILLRADQVID